jgi:hypothetical protein
MEYGSGYTIVISGSPSSLFGCFRRYIIRAKLSNANTAKAPTTMATVAPVDILQRMAQSTDKAGAILTHPFLSDTGAVDCVGNEVSIELELEEVELVVELVVETVEVDVVVTIGT